MQFAMLRRLAAATLVLALTVGGALAQTSPMPVPRGGTGANNAAGARTNLGVAIGSDVQAYDAELAALAGLTSANNKCFYWTGAGTAANFDCSAFGRSLANAADAAALRTLGGLVIGTDVQAYDADLAALAANASNGLWSRTGAGTGAARTITAPAAGITVSNGDGVAGNPTLALADDLAALEALSTTGLCRRTGTSTWSCGSAVTNAELATMATGTFKGNVSGSTAVPSDLSAAQVTAALNAVVGDSGTGGTKGLVPAPGAGDASAGKYLDASGAWSVPAGGGGSGGMSTAERQNFMLGCIYQAKSFGGYRRGIEQFCDGFKASDGIAAGSSSNYSLDTATGKVAPSSAGGTVHTGSTPNTTTGFGGVFTVLDRSNAVANSVTIKSVGVYLTTAQTSVTVKVAKENSSTNFDIVASSTGTCNHPGGGWYDCDLDLPYTVPATGTYRVGFSANLSTNSFVSTGTRATASGNLTGTNQTMSNATDGTIGMRYTEAGTTNNMTVVSTAQTADATVSQARALVEYNPVDAITLNTDLTAEVTCNGGTSWATATLSAAGKGQAGRSVAETDDHACATSGTSFALRLKSANAKKLDVYGAALTAH